MKTCGGIISLHVSSLRLFNCISMKVCMGGQNTTLTGEFDVYFYHFYKMLKLLWDLMFPECCCWSFMAVRILRCSFWNTPKLPQQVPNGVNGAWIILLYPSWLLSFMWPTHPRCLGGHLTVTAQPRPLHVALFNILQQNSKFYLDLTFFIPPAVIIQPGSTVLCISCYWPPTHLFCDCHHVT
jgi:hypothetical protein